MATACTALLVVDMQVGVLDGCFDADGVLARTAALAARARREGVPVLWVQHEDEELVRDSPPWQLATGLVPRADEPVVCKIWRDAFADTPLQALLAARGIDRLVVAGAQSDYCVRTAAQTAVARGFSVALVSDAHTTTDACFDGVAVTGEQIVAHTNQYFSGLRYPGADIGIATHDAVALGG